MDESWSGGHLNDSAWWWAVAADGIVGGLLTGAVAAAAVWFTLRHERRKQAMEAVSDVASRLLGQLLVSPTALAAGSNEERAAVMRATFATGIEFSSKLAKWWPSRMLDVQRKTLDMYTLHRRRPTSASGEEFDAWRLDLARKVSVLANACAQWLMEQPRPESWIARRKIRGEVIKTLEPE